MNQPPVEGKATSLGVVSGTAATLATWELPCGALEATVLRANATLGKAPSKLAARTTTTEINGMREELFIMGTPFVLMERSYDHCLYGLNRYTKNIIGQNKIRCDLRHQHTKTA